MDRMDRQLARSLVEAALLVISKAEHVGPFVLDGASHPEFLDDAKKLLDTVTALFARAGVHLKGPISIRLAAERGKQTSTYDGEMIHIHPQHMTKAGEGIFIHELSHYVHDKLLPGGLSNPAIKAKYDEVIREHSHTHHEVKHVGEQPQDLTDPKLLDWIEAQESADAVRELLVRVANFEKSIMTRFKPGTVLKLHGPEDPMNQSSPVVERKCKIVKKKGEDFVIEILNPTEADLRVRDGKTPALDTLTLPALKRTPPFDRAFGAIYKAKYAANEKVYQLEKDKGAHDAAHYEKFIADWLPTEYAKKNNREWFAELLTAYVFHPSKFAEPVRDFLVGLLKQA